MKKRNLYLACFSLAVMATISGCGNTASTIDSKPDTAVETTEKETDSDKDAKDKDDTEITTRPEKQQGHDGGEHKHNLDKDDSVERTSRYGSYYDFMLNEAKDGNAVFSSESLDSAFYVYSGLLDDDSKAVIREYLGNVNYLEYENTDVFKSVNRVWGNTMYDIHLEDTEVADFAYLMDMSDSKKATDIKDAYVDEQTNHFIDSTKSILDKDVIFDVMNVTYFKDVWKGGKRILTDDLYDFHNADGTTVQVPMMKGFDGKLYATDNAHAFSTAYENGFIFVAVLPEKGVSLSDVDIDAFISGTANEVDADCNFYMPEFETKSDFECSFSDFGVDAGNIDPSVYTGDVRNVIFQTAKIKVDCEGTEAAAVTEILVKANGIEEMRPTYDMVCNRPFVYYIYDTVNNDVAFMGVVNCK